MDNELGTELAVTTGTEVAKVDLEKAKTLCKSINPKDGNSILQFGLSTQTNISSLSDSMIGQVRNKDAGAVGAALSELVFKIKEVDVAGLPDKANWLTGIFNSVKKFVARYDKVAGELTFITDKLNNGKMVLARDITMLDQFYEKNLEFISNLDLFIAAGKMKLAELNMDLESAKAKYTSSQDPLDAQAQNDLEQFIHRFEKRIFDLELTRNMAIQTAPTIRIIQNNNQALMEKINATINFTIPAWKRTIVIAFALDRQDGIAQNEKDITDATNKFLQQASDMMKATSIKVATENERGAIDMETLKKTNADLISTIEETQRIQNEGRQKRLAAESELMQLESSLKSTLTKAKEGVL